MRRDRGRQNAEFGALAPAYWAIGPWLNLVPYLFVPCVFAAIGLSRWTGIEQLPIPTLAVVIAFSVAATAVRSKVVLAEGGLWIRHYGGIFKRFIPYSDIADVGVTQRIGKQIRSNTAFSSNLDYLVFHAVRLTLKSGARVSIPTICEEESFPANRRFGMGEEGHFQGTHQTTRILQREIQERIDAEERLPVPSPAVAAMMRGDRSVAEWHAALAERLPETHDAYRGDAQTELLWRVVEDEDAPRDARAGAAIALRKQLDDDGRARLRVVAESCESPKLRVALDAALDEEIEEERVLAALERASNRTE